MALQLASILDELAPNPEWAERACVALNKSLSKIPVQHDYNIAVTVGNRSYLLTSTVGGVISITSVPCSANALDTVIKMQCRVILDADAVFESQKDMIELVTKRKLQFQGDTNQLRNFESDIGPHMSMLQQQSDVGSDEIQVAVEEHNRLVDEEKMMLEACAADASQYQLSVIQGQLGANAELPLVVHFSSCLQYSACSNPMGNPGQSNYCAANHVLDVLTFGCRTSDKLKNFDACAIMWGAVGGIGMRWKAFASQDMLGDGTNSDTVLQPVVEAQAALGYFIGLRQVGR